ncbi:UNVERIFIED_CONTAM: Beta-glucosidase 18 [Sesamum indicum]
MTWVFVSHCLILLLSALISSAEKQVDIKRSDFPHGFFFGASTSAYQIEGAVLEDGKGLSNWDVYCRIKGDKPEFLDLILCSCLFVAVEFDFWRALRFSGTIADGTIGDIANDHYHRYMEDIEIMHSLGLTAYRFSISWSRVLPRGRLGGVNQAGITFYNSIIDNLLLRGIQPFVTIFHNEYPQEFEDRFGGWLSSVMQEEFVHFAETCFKHFADRVKYWMTMNEPNVFAEMAYESAMFPPARCSSPFGHCAGGNSDVEPLIAMHNMLLAHAKAAKLYREQYKSKVNGVIGITVCAYMFTPLRDFEDDIQAANRALAFNAAWMLDPLVFGDYPPEMKRYHGSELPSFSSEERGLLRDSIDFMGINHYGELYAKDCIHSSCVCNDSVYTLGSDRLIRGFVYTTGERNGVPIGEPTGMSQFFVVPRGMEDIVNYMKERYHNKPMFVTENGKYLHAVVFLYACLPCLCIKKVDDSYCGDVIVVTALRANEDDIYQHDVKRVRYHQLYLASLAQAMRNGADVRGYFIWSLMDNFEWSSGYSLKFGIYRIDPQTLNRIPKLSATWYKDFLSNSSLGGVDLSSTVPNGSKDVSRGITLQWYSSFHGEILSTITTLIGVKARSRENGTRSPQSTVPKPALTTHGYSTRTTQGTPRITKTRQYTRKPTHRISQR